MGGRHREDKRGDSIAYVFGLQIRAENQVSRPIRRTFQLRGQRGVHLFSEVRLTVGEAKGGVEEFIILRPEERPSGDKSLRDSKQRGIWGGKERRVSRTVYLKGA